MQTCPVQNEIMVDLGSNSILIAWFEFNFDCMVLDLDPISSQNRLDGFGFSIQVY